MKKWRCTVCGYIHTGDEPPEKCPICGADKSKFVEIVEEESSIGPQLSEETQTTPAEQVKSWVCSVCGHTYDAAYPSQKCLMCGAEGSSFSEGEKLSSLAPQEPPLQREQATKAPSGAPVLEKKKLSPSSLYDVAAKLILKHHLHPISAHIPNGVLPVSVLFIFFATVFHHSNLALAAFYNMVFVVLTLPVVLFTGFTEWRNHYNKAMSRLFIIKICCAIGVSICAVIALTWWIIDPGITGPTSPHRWTFLLLNLAMLGFAGGAGFIGGKLVFKD